MRPGRTLDERPVVAPLPGRAVVPPADGLQHRHRRGLERVAPGEAAQPHLLGEPLVEGGRAGPDLREERLDAGDERAPLPVRLPVVDVVVVEERAGVEPVHPHLDVARPGAGPHVAVVGQLAEPGTGHPRRDRAQRGVAGRDGRPLGVAVVGVAPHADDPVGPLLLDQPVEGVVTVDGLVDEEQRLALGAELAPHVLDHDVVAASHEVRRDQREVGVGADLVVGQSDQDRRSRLVPRPVDVGRQPDPVAHPHHPVLGPVVERGRADVLDLELDAVGHSEHLEELDPDLVDVRVVVRHADEDGVRQPGVLGRVGAEDRLGAEVVLRRVEPLAGLEGRVDLGDAAQKPRLTMSM